MSLSKCSAASSAESMPTLHKQCELVRMHCPWNVHCCWTEQAAGKLYIAGMRAKQQAYRSSRDVISSPTSVSTSSSLPVSTSAKHTRSIQHILNHLNNPKMQRTAAQAKL